jgi:hypothetical protein
MSRLAGLSGTAKNRVFGGLFAVVLLLAIFPPLYLWAGGVETQILGMPFSVAYMLFDAVLVTALIAVLYVVEDARGELD